MDITVTFKAHPDLLDLLQGFVNALSGKSAAVTESKPAAGKTKKETAKQEPVKEQVTESDFADTTEAEDTVDDTALTIDEVRSYVTPKIQGGKRDGVAALFEEFGAKGLTTLDKKDYSAFIEKVKAL